MHHRPDPANPFLLTAAGRMHPYGPAPSRVRSSRVNKGVGKCELSSLPGMGGDDWAGC